MASGHVNRTNRGRTHGRTDQACDVKIFLANLVGSTLLTAAQLRTRPAANLAS